MSGAGAAAWAVEEFAWFVGNPANSDASNHLADLALLRDAVQDAIVSALLVREGNGLTLQECGDALGVSRQAAAQMIRRAELGRAS